MDEANALGGLCCSLPGNPASVVRLLVRAGPAGMAAGAVAEAIGAASSSRMSFHLAQLEHAGLVRSRRDGRSIIYSAVYPSLAELVSFLMPGVRDGASGGLRSRGRGPVVHLQRGGLP